MSSVIALCPGHVAVRGPRPVAMQEDFNAETTDGLAGTANFAVIAAMDDRGCYVD
jgi:hypothetical protein